jgi:hypothetical protein
MKYIKISLLVLASLIALAIGVFYISPYLSQKYYPAPDSKELKNIQKSFSEKGYLTAEDVAKLNEFGTKQIQNLKNNDPQDQHQ